MAYSRFFKKKKFLSDIFFSFSRIISGPSLINPDKTMSHAQQAKKAGGGVVELRSAEHGGGGEEEKKNI